MGFVTLFFGMYLITTLVTLGSVVSLPNEKSINNDWIAIAKDGAPLQTLELDDLTIRFHTDRTSEEMFPARSRRSTTNQDDTMISKITSFLREGRHEAAYLLYSKAIDRTSTGTTNRDDLIRRIVYDAYQLSAIPKILDFVTLKLDQNFEICVWMNALFEIVTDNDHFASIEGLHLCETTQTIARRIINSNRDETCMVHLDQVSVEMFEPQERLATEWVKSIHSGNYTSIIMAANEFPLAFDSIIRLVIIKAVGETFMKQANMSFVERLKNTFSFINRLPTTSAINTLNHLNQLLEFIEPHFILMSERPMLAESVISVNQDELPLPEPKELIQLKNEIDFKIKKIVQDPCVFIYRIDKTNNGTRKFLTINTSKRFGSTKEFTRFYESNTIQESNKWILEQINNADQYRIKNKESGEYLYAYDENSTDGFTNSRSGFSFKLNNGSDIESLGNRTVWVLTPLFGPIAEQYTIMNLHWKEYLDSNNTVLNETHTWKEPANNPWIISDVRNVEKFRLVCFFESSATQREGAGRFTPDNIDPTLCTHLIYSYARIDNDTAYVMKTRNEQIDIADKGYEKILALKQQNPQLKVIIQLDGWDVDEKYMRLHSDPANIKTFVKSAVDFLQIYGFDGIHFDWQFLSSEDHKEGMISLLTALYNVFKSKRYMLSATVSSQSDAIKNVFDIPKLNQILEFIGVAAFFYHGNWESKTMHHASLFREFGDGTLNGDHAVKELISEGASPNKIVLGIPFFGNTWALKSIYDGIFAPGGPRATPGKIIQSPNQMAYYEICEVVQNDGWKVSHTHNHKMGPYAVSPIEPNKNRTWVGYDDPAMAAVKAYYILSKGLGGAYVWDVSMDDFHNICGGGVNPMLNAIANTLGIKASNSTTV